MHDVYHKYTTGVAELPFLRLLPVDIESGELPLYAEVLCAERDRLRGFLRSRDIETRPVPPNLSISGYIEKEPSYPNSDAFAEQAMYLPCGPEQPLENIDRVVETLWAYRGHQ